MDGEGDFSHLRELLLYPVREQEQGESRAPLTTPPATYINLPANPSRYLHYYNTPYLQPQSYTVNMSGYTHQQQHSWQGQGEQQRPHPSAHLQQQAQPNMNGQQQQRPNPFTLLERQLLQQWSPTKRAEWQQLSQEQKAQWLAQNQTRLQQMTQHQASPPRATPQSQANIPIDPSILTMGANNRHSQQRRQNEARRLSGGVPQQYAQGPFSSDPVIATPSRPAANTSRSPQNISANGQRPKATPRASAVSPPIAGSHMPTLSRPSMSQGHVQQSPLGQQCPSGSSPIPTEQLQQQWAQATSRQPFEGGAVQAPKLPQASGQGQQRALMSPPKPSAQYQQQRVPQNRSSQPQDASPSRQPSYHPVQQGQKRQAISQPDSPAHPEKRVNIMQPPPLPSTLGHQDGYTNGASNTTQHLIDQRQYLTTEQRQAAYRTNEQRLAHENHLAYLAAQKVHEERLAEQKRTNDEFLAAQASRLKRERLLRRKEELYKDPSAIYRHYDEYLKHFPLGPGESKNGYCVRLLANRPIYEGGDEEFNDAVRLAKEEWGVFAQYPKDVGEYTRKAKERKAKLAAITA